MNIMLSQGYKPGDLHAAFCGSQNLFLLITCAEEKMKTGKEKHMTTSDFLGFIQITLCLGTFICSMFGYCSFLQKLRSILQQ